MPDLPADYVAARARMAKAHCKAGRCDRCGLPLTLGQPGRHYMCRHVAAVDQAEADAAAWSSLDIDPDAPPLWPPCSPPS